MDSSGRKSGIRAGRRSDCGQVDAAEELWCTLVTGSEETGGDKVLCGQNGVRHCKLSACLCEDQHFHYLAFSVS